MRLGIIGAGNVGGALGRLLEAQGHDVRFGVRDPEKQAGGGLPHSRLGTVADVAAFGDVILLAVPWSAVKDALAATGPLAGKTVIDAVNPVLSDLSGLAVGTTTFCCRGDREAHPSSESREVLQHARRRELRASRVR